MPKPGVAVEERWYSPVVIQLARDAKIPKEELDTLQGTGYEGRLSKKDIKDYIDRKKRGLVSEPKKTSLELTCKLLNLSLSTFIRRAIHNVKIEKTVIVAGGGEETLTAVSTLLAQCSKVGSNLNQLARHFNSGGADTEQIRAKLLDELADLTAFRLHAEKVLGELYGNAQAYKL